MGCQTEIAKEIIAKDVDYVLSLKGNQGKTHEQVEAYFEEAPRSRSVVSLPKRCALRPRMYPLLCSAL